MFDVLIEACCLDYVGAANNVDSILAVQEVCRQILTITQEYCEKNG